MLIVVALSIGLPARWDLPPQCFSTAAVQAAGRRKCRHRGPITHLFLSRRSLVEIISLLLLSFLLGANSSKKEEQIAENHHRLNHVDGS